MNWLYGIVISFFLLLCIFEAVVLGQWIALGFVALLVSGLYFVFGRT
jgi:hypothetical protein